MRSEAEIQAVKIMLDIVSELTDDNDKALKTLLSFSGELLCWVECCNCTRAKRFDAFINHPELGINIKEIMKTIRESKRNGQQSASIHEC